MAPLFLIAGTAVVVFVVHRVVGALRALHSIGYLPGRRSLLGFRSILYHILPQIKYIKGGRNRAFEDGHTYFEEVGWDAYSIMTFWPKIEYSIHIADAAAIKDIATTRRFPKPTHLYGAVDVFGPNIVSSDGDLWKKYRKISGPSFSEKNNRLVWEETLHVVDDLIDNVWGNTDATVDHGVNITLPLALLVIGAAGFGQRVTWEDSAVAPGNHKLTFRNALNTAASNLVLNFLLPDWVKRIPHPKLAHLRLANDELKSYMREMIRDREAIETQDKHDLFSSLIHANKEELEGQTLREDELMGNIFIFLVAGHETTAHTLSFTFALLALYPEIQEKLYEHIKSVIPDGRRPTYEDMPKFTYVMAVYNETIRLFSPVSGISKMAPEDTSIVVGNCFNDEQKRIPIPKGTSITIHVPGVQRNPKYWENPNEFIPERFLGDWNRDALVGFSVGPRACLGRKFNESEGVAVLVSLISRYKIELQDEPQFKHETFEERKTRILTTKLTLTLAPKRLPLVFRKRSD